jgi:hypothetical protein
MGLKIFREDKSTNDCSPFAADRYFAHTPLFTWVFYALVLDSLLRFVHSLLIGLIPAYLNKTKLRGVFAHLFDWRVLVINVNVALCK